MQSRIREQGYDPVEFEKLGAVLLLMQDTLQAGKYLFLSGSEREEYRAAIALYIQRSGTNLDTILPTLPRCVRKGVSDRFPDGVAAHLIGLGIPVLPPSSPEPELTRFNQSSWISYGCMLGVLAIFVLAALGLYSLVKAFWK